MKKLIMAISLACLGACGSSDDDTDTLFVQGLQTGNSFRPVDEIMAALETNINEIDGVSILEPQIDHQANAMNIADPPLELRPTRVTLFGNPLLGTPLIQLNQLAGLDLPQKMFAWEDAAGQSHVAYNTTEYLTGRHGLAEAEEQLTRIDGALATFAANAAGQEITPLGVTEPALGEGIIVVESRNDINTTFSNLEQAIINGPLTLVATLDHSANAASVNLTLRPTRLLVFGNPNLGTPLMQSGQTIGIDLPQKMLVFEDENGVVSVAYNDPAYLAQRHGITDQQEVIDTISDALSNLVMGATSAP